MANNDQRTLIHNTLLFRKRQLILAGSLIEEVLSSTTFLCRTMHQMHVVYTISTILVPFQDTLWHTPRTRITQAQVSGGFADAHLNYSVFSVYERVPEICPDSFFIQLHIA